MTYRDRFIDEVAAQLGLPVLWGQKGPKALDCSGSITRPIKLVGGPDLTLTHNAQGLANATRPLGDLEAPLPGDLVFYGFGEGTIEHVAMYRKGGGVISADGATSHIDPAKLGLDRALKISMANPANRVRLHDSYRYRPDTPYVAIHRNTIVDELDGVEQ